MHGINDGYTINFQGRARARLEIRIRKQRLLNRREKGKGGREGGWLDFATTTQRV